MKKSKEEFFVSEKRAEKGKVRFFELHFDELSAILLFA